MAVQPDDQLALDERQISVAIAAFAASSFDAEASTRIRITLAEDAAPKKERHLRSVSDDDDLRPAGKVNVDELRGAVDRAAPPDRNVH